MDKQAFDAMVRQYAADLMGMAARSTLPPEPASPPAEETSPQPEAPAPIEPDEGVEINPPESGPGVDPLQPAVPEPESYESFLADNPKMGELRIQASAGGGLCRFPERKSPFPGILPTAAGCLPPALPMAAVSWMVSGCPLPTKAAPKARNQANRPMRRIPSRCPIRSSRPRCLPRCRFSKGSSLSSPSGSCRRGRTFNREAST